MSENMVERVTRAINDALTPYEIRLTEMVGDRTVYTLNFGDLSPQRFASYREASEALDKLQGDRTARAVLDALREPTAAMITAAHAVGDSFGRGPSDQEWRAMLRAALAEPASPPTARDAGVRQAGGA